MTSRKELHEKYPDLLAVKEGTERMPYGWFGIESPNGWNDLLDGLLSKIQDHLKRHPMPDFYIAQIKEKFGGLRFYFGNGDDEIRKLVLEAESQSYKTCDMCGAPGNLRDDRSWMRTLCDQCHENNPETYKRPKFQK